MATLTLGTLSILFVLTLLLSSAYLFFRDDLVSATLARHARMQHAYEDRISALRAQVDMVTSRQLLDQQVVEDRVARLMARQDEIGVRQRRVRDAISRASKAKAATKTSRKPPLPAISGSAGSSTPNLRLGSLIGTQSPFAESQRTPTNSLFAHAGPELFDSLEATLEETEQAQLAELTGLKKAADHKASKLAAILGKQGIRIPNATAIGGPLIELKGANKFLDTVSALDASLETLEKVRRAAKSLPHGSPTPGQKISSRFGSRKDPFTGARAVHGGLDFRARRGVPVFSTASGVVTKAGRLGGYGKLVEIDHGGGIKTRYAHLSKIRVKVGQRIDRKTRVGNVGSTGRSTGPHLHYEVRRNGRVLNPIHYVRLAKHLNPYL